MRYNEDTKQIEMTIEEMADIFRGVSAIQDLLRIFVEQPQLVEVKSEITLSQDGGGQMKLPPKVVEEITIAMLEGIKKVTFALRPNSTD